MLLCVITYLLWQLLRLIKDNKSEQKANKELSEYNAKLLSENIVLSETYHELFTQFNKLL